MPPYGLSGGICTDGQQAGSSRGRGDLSRLCEGRHPHIRTAGRLAGGAAAATLAVAPRLPPPPLHKLCALPFEPPSEQGLVSTRPRPPLPVLAPPLLSPGTSGAPGWGGHKASHTRSPPPLPPPPPPRPRRRCGGATAGCPPPRRAAAWSLFASARLATAQSGRGGAGGAGGVGRQATSATSKGEQAHAYAPTAKGPKLGPFCPPLPDPRGPPFSALPSPLPAPPAAT